ncbi:MAG: FMN-binding negative transcriptional regulator [Pseudobdellovibrionaceae bacterium]
MNSQPSLYLPSRFKQENLREILSLIGENPLATVISTTKGEPFVSHIPLIVQKYENGLKLIGHLARVNPHWKLIDGQPLTAIFHGPNAYITPNWYAENDVPTWNYAVVHAVGQGRLISDYDGIVACLKSLTAQVEAQSKNPWNFWLPTDLESSAELTSAITGFEIDVKDINAKFKLSQNRSLSDRNGTIAGLESERTDENSRKISELMKRICNRASDS